MLLQDSHEGRRNRGCRLSIERPPDDYSSGSRRLARWSRTTGPRWGCSCGNRRIRHSPVTALSGRKDQRNYATIRRSRNRRVRRLEHRSCPRAEHANVERLMVITYGVEAFQSLQGKQNITKSCPAENVTANREPRRSRCSTNGWLLHGLLHPVQCYRPSVRNYGADYGGSRNEAIHGQVLATSDNGSRCNKVVASFVGQVFRSSSQVDLLV